MYADNPTAHHAVARALSQLNFKFDQALGNGSSERLRGFAKESVVEVVRGPPMTVALLFSASLDARPLARSAVCLVTVASVLGIDFAGWLAGELQLNGLVNPWKVSHVFGDAKVSAEHLSEDAVLLTIEARASLDLT